jgi:HK97 family phage major capsid protein
MPPDTATAPTNGTATNGRYHSLVQRRLDLMKASRAVLTAAEAEGRTLTDAEKAADDAAHTERLVVEGEIERWERQLSAERTATLPNGRAPATARARIADDPMRGFSGIADFAMAVYGSVMGRRADPRLVALEEIGEGLRAAPPTETHRETGSTDGYMVPPQIREGIWELVYELDNLLALVDAEPTSSNMVEILKDETTPWGATGLQAYWGAELEQKRASRLAQTPMMIRLHKLYVLAVASDELLEDAPRLEARLMNKAAQAIKWKTNEAIIYGNGGSQPLGWMNSPALVTVAAAGGQTADTIVPANIVAMIGRLIAGSLARSMWIMNTDAYAQLPLMAAANGALLFMPPGGLTSAPAGTLWGRPIMLSEHAAAIGDLGDIQLVDPKGYYAAHKGTEPKFASSIHLYFDYDATAFRWVFRVGGAPYLSAPITPARGASTKSHFVTLAAR